MENESEELAPEQPAPEQQDPEEPAPEQQGRPYAERKEDHLRRLRRVEGQLRGLQRMVSEDVYCIDVLTQVSAATKALQSFALELLDEHMSGCVVDAARTSDEEARTKVREANDAIARLVRS